MRMIETLNTKGDQMMANSIRARKEVLRKQVKAARKELDEDYLRAASREITAHILGSELYRNATTIFAYMNYGKEVITDELIAAALEAGKRICIPLCLSDNQMEAKLYQSDADLHLGKYDIREPNADAVTVAPEEIDLAIIPCLSCDPRGNRLGHGAGYYDRYLANTSFVKMALCPEKLLMVNVATDKFDVRMDAVVTEKGLIQIGGWK